MKKFCIKIGRGIKRKTQLESKLTLEIELDCDKGIVINVHFY